MHYRRNSIRSSKVPKLPWVMYGTYILIPSSLPFEYLSRSKLHNDASAGGLWGRCHTHWCSRGESGTVPLAHLRRWNFYKGKPDLFQALMHSNWGVLNTRSNSGALTQTLLLLTPGPPESSREGLYHWLWRWCGVAVGCVFGALKGYCIDCLNLSGLNTHIFITKCPVLLNIHESEQETPTWGNEKVWWFWTAWHRCSHHSA